MEPKKFDLETVYLDDENDAVVLLDQTRFANCASVELQP